MTPMATTSGARKRILCVDDDEDTRAMIQARGYQADIAKGLDAGAQAYLVELDFDHLEQTIDRLIDEAGSTTHH